MRRLGLLLALVLMSSALVGCDDDTTDPVVAPTPTTVTVKAPRVGSCYRLDVAAGLEISSSAPKVACAKRHTSVTVAVSRIRKTSGKVLPIESAPVQRQIARACKAKVDAHVGGSTEARRLSRVQAVWFSPPPEQLAAGARWYRCDLVVAGNRTSFTPLPRRTAGLLDGSAGLRRYGTCGTAAPGADGFRRVACGAKHSWRARASINLPAGTAYLGAKAGKKADATCRDIEARRAVTATRLRWSFEWPTRAQWAAGQRWGICWTPDP